MVERAKKKSAYSGRMVGYPSVTKNGATPPFQNLDSRSIKIVLRIVDEKLSMPSETLLDGLTLSLS
jgi:hypothetical protein